MPTADSALQTADHPGQSPVGVFESAGWRSIHATLPHG